MIKECTRKRVCASAVLQSPYDVQGEFEIGQFLTGDVSKEKKVVLLDVLDFSELVATLEAASRLRKNPVLLAY